MNFEPRQNETPPPPEGGVPGIEPTTTSTENPSPPTNTDGLPTNTDNPKSGSSSGPNPGAIAGGVIAGVVLVALIVVAFLFIRRRKRRIAPSAEFLARNPNWRSDTPTSTAEHTGDEQPPPFTEGSYAYALLPEKRRSQPV
ncbi:hypothetical protein PQX77_018936 [Marasmius sp. AFHP31]|nr:hypothetical protein PQX77_018936 [Marasmius sp. AFHP31]